jgi:hypothetical protein
MKTAIRERGSVYYVDLKVTPTLWNDRGLFFDGFLGPSSQINTVAASGGALMLLSSLSDTYINPFKFYSVRVIPVCSGHLAV